MINEKMITTNTSETDSSKTSRTARVQQVGSFFTPLKIYFSKLYYFFRDNKNNSKMMLFVAIVTSLIAITLAIRLYLNVAELNNQSAELYTLARYDTRILTKNETTNQLLKTSETVQDILQENTSLQSEINKYTTYLSALQVPYTYLLQYIYLPSLNVWKEKYTETINTNLIGIQFLENNPFNDITLLQTWGDFFKNLGDNNESNDIIDMQIGSFAENASWYFTMPITVSFVANSKRAFLLLVDKLSMTSNRENIALINEFFYYLRSEIKKEKATEIQTLTKNYANIFGTQEINQDKIIGYHLYHWIFHQEKNILIDNDLLDKTVKSIISCNNQSEEICYYKFREKYRNLPMLWYVIGNENTTNTPDNLKKFIQQLPPIFAIQSFEFDTVKSPTLADATNNKYQGKVVISVYGKSATTTEVQEIASVLGKKCLLSAQPLTTAESLTLIQNAIVKLSDGNKIDTTYGDDLRELKQVVSSLDEEFPTLSNYKKTIKLFELYRMLTDAGLCK